MKGRAGRALGPLHLKQEGLLEEQPGAEATMPCAQSSRGWKLLGEAQPRAAVGSVGWKRGAPGGASRAKGRSHMQSRGGGVGGACPQGGDLGDLRLGSHLICKATLSAKAE